nr:hypothetical protein CFP56_79315 [Quercus suber]
MRLYCTRDQSRSVEGTILHICETAKESFERSGWGSVEVKVESKREADITKNSGLEWLTRRSDEIPVQL